MSLTVSRVSKLAKVSVRTLHHYDEMGLLTPSGRSEAGYRLYEDADLQRLQLILFFRELGFPLEEVKRILTADGFDLERALAEQRRLLASQADRARRLVGLIDRMLENLQGAMTMDHEKMFGDFDPSQYEEEVKERWGNTDAYRESAKRTARYGPKDWAAIKAEAEQVGADLVALMDAGKPADSVEAMDAAERARLHIGRWFYPCSYAMHRNLGELYVDDERFTQNIDKARPGLAVFWRDAIRANCARHGAV